MVFQDEKDWAITIVRPFVLEATEISMSGRMEKDRILAEGEFRMARPFELKLSWAIKAKGCGQP